uniref:HMG box domain-containing protein n=1 Tax=Macrostomum lignano TaxID=282301 RepID=A0A1I8I6W1_9PLAT
MLSSALAAANGIRVCARQVAGISWQLYEKPGQAHLLSKTLSSLEQPVIKPVNHYAVFVKSNFAKVRSENPGLTPAAAMAEVARIYKQLDEAELAKLKEEAAALKSQSAAVESSADASAKEAAKKARRKMQLFARRHGMPALANVSWYSLLFAERTSGQKGKKPLVAGQAQPTVPEEERERLRQRAAQVNAERSAELKRWAESHGISGQLRPSTIVRKFYKKYA